MSEFQTEIDVTKLLGSAPGYVGYKESGLLVKSLAKKPECVCLFDEIEKAHPKIYDVLLQLLDEGSITGSDGVKVDGSKALIIFTSNIGVKSAKELANPMGITENYEELKNKREESIMVKALKKRFSPEFLNRLDSVCYFNNLSREVLNSILQKEMNEMNKGIKNITHKEVELSEDVRNWILDKVEIEHNGARPIIRLLEQEIEEEIANLVINESELLEKESDKFNSMIFIDIDEDIFKSKDFLMKNFFKKEAYLLQYAKPICSDKNNFQISGYIEKKNIEEFTKDKEYAIEEGNIIIKDEKIIIHNIPTSSGAAGGPIISHNKFKVIGYHVGKNKSHMKFQGIGNLLKFPIQEFINIFYP
jgi:hypothetical protein